MDQQHRNADNLSSTNSPQLPDLLNGTEITRERQDRQEIDKLNILKGLGEFNQVNSLQGYSNTSAGESFFFAMFCDVVRNFFFFSNFQKIGKI